MSVGKVTFYSESKGYGFILQIDGREIYFHQTALQERSIGRMIQPGITVTYDLIETSLGPEASNVRSAAPNPI